jgi:hypothetical protein
MLRWRGGLSQGKAVNNTTMCKDGITRNASSNRPEGPVKGWNFAGLNRLYVPMPSLSLGDMRPEPLRRTTGYPPCTGGMKATSCPSLTASSREAYSRSTATKRRPCHCRRVGQRSETDSMRALTVSPDSGIGHHVSSVAVRSCNTEKKRSLT